MAFVKEKAQWEKGIYQFEITDPLEGGEDGIDNLPGRQLANRTVYLKEKCEKVEEKLTALEKKLPDKLNEKNSELEAKINVLYEKLYDTYSKYETNMLVEKINNEIQPTLAALASEIEHLKGSSGESDYIVGEVRQVHQTHDEAHANDALTDESKDRNLLSVLTLGKYKLSPDEAIDREIIPSLMKFLKIMCMEGNFSGLRSGDYLDLPEIVMGYDGAIGGTEKKRKASTAPYKSTRIIISAFNPYKNADNKKAISYLPSVTASER